MSANLARILIINFFPPICTSSRGDDPLDPAVGIPQLALFSIEVIFTTSVFSLGTPLLELQFPGFSFGNKRRCLQSPLLLLSFNFFQLHFSVYLSSEFFCCCEVKARKNEKQNTNGKGTCLTRLKGSLKSSPVRLLELSFRVDSGVEPLELNPCRAIASRSRS